MRPGLEPAPRAVHLLPGFDEFVLGYTDRTAQLPKEHFLTIVPGGNGVFLPTIVVDGQVVGTWRRGGRRDEVTMFALAPFGLLSAATISAAIRAACAYADSSAPRSRSRPALPQRRRRRAR